MPKNAIYERIHTVFFHLKHTKLSYDVISQDSSYPLVERGIGRQVMAGRWHRMALLWCDRVNFKDICTD